MRLRSTLLPTLGALLMVTLLDFTGAAPAAPATASDASTGAGAVAPNSVRGFGAPQLGDLAGQALHLPVIGMAATPDRGGYWLLCRDGGVFTFGDATFHGSTGDLTLNEPMVAMAADGATGGYWTVATDGGVFSFDSPFYGSTGNLTLNQPIVGMAATPDGGGYWLVASDGGIFAFGDAPFLGSTGNINLNKPIVGMAATPDGGGYWLVASDGGIFAFGDAPFLGSTASTALNQPVIGMAATPDGRGYWLAARDGGIFTFGTAAFSGSALSDGSIPAVAVTAGATGYRVAYGHLPSPFGPNVTDFLAQREGSVTAALHDAETGQTWFLNPGQVQVTASIVKVDIMATAFEEAAQQGQPVPPAEQDLMYPMIEVSDNNAATALWNDVGGPSAIASYNRNFELDATTLSTKPTTPDVSGWAFSTTSAADQLKVVGAFAFHNAVLSDGARSFGLSLMEHIDPAQAWGIPADAPPGVTVALKTGNYPLTPTDYQVNSVGYLSGADQSYVYAILTTGNPDEGYGISTINSLATAMYDALSSG
ncbi:MAG TPA: serine hydrolase [Acidimicrobiales bacterium]|nr:serine hydrolase [Acidimicrobiales bacterium]